MTGNLEKVIDHYPGFYSLDVDNMERVLQWYRRAAAHITTRRGGVWSEYGCHNMPNCVAHFNKFTRYGNVGEGFWFSWGSLAMREFVSQYWKEYR